MTKYLGVSMIVLGTIILLVSYLSQSCDAIAGMFPISWVDINGVQLVGLFHLVIGGLLAHILGIKLASSDKEISDNNATIGLASAVVSLVLAVVPLCIPMENQPEFLPLVSIYGGLLTWLAGLIFTFAGNFSKKKTLAMAGFGVLALSLILTLVTSITVYAEV